MFDVEDRVKEIGKIIIWHVKRLNEDGTYLLSERDRYGNFFGRNITRTFSQLEKVK